MPALRRPARRLGPRLAAGLAVLLALGLLLVVTQLRGVPNQLSRPIDKPEQVGNMQDCRFAALPPPPPAAGVALPFYLPSLHVHPWLLPCSPPS